MHSDVPDLLHHLGGVARRAALLGVVTRAELDRAVAAGLVIRDARGVYALPGTDEALRLAARLGGVLSHSSAAIQHGWGAKTVPDKPHVTVSRGRKLGPERALVHLHRAELTPADHTDAVTSQARTLLDCLRFLPADEALCVADSAVRESGCQRLMEQVAEAARGPGSRQAREVAAQATGLAANPFESVLRSICRGVPGLEVRPQVTIHDDDFWARADLVDERLHIVCEADSFAWHGSRSALTSDARRYNRMVVAGWIVLRFTYEDVMFRPDEVRKVLRAAVALAELLTERAETAQKVA